jgi:hypothetical protein
MRAQTMMPWGFKLQQLQGVITRFWVDVVAGTPAPPPAAAVQFKTEAILRSELALLSIHHH